MNKIVCLLCLCMSLTVFCSCDDEANHELSDIALIITPAATDTVKLQAGEKQIFTMRYYVNTGGKVNRLQVKSVDNENGELLLEDTIYTEEIQEATFIYVAPQTTKEQLDVTLTFVLYETTGTKTKQIRKVRVTNKLLMLQEYGPVVLYMATDKADAIMFDSPTQTFDHVLEGENRQSDLYLAVDTLAEGDYAISFASETEARFVRANSFDYAAASSNAIQTVYGNSVRTARVSDLQTHDIVIVGHGTQAEGILFVQHIIRQGTDNELCMQMRYKPLQKVEKDKPQSAEDDNRLENSGIAK